MGLTSLHGGFVTVTLSFQSKSCKNLASLLDLAEIAESYDLDEIENFHKFFPWLSQECFEEHEAMLRTIVLDDGGVWGFAAEAVLAAFAEEDMADADWLAQKIRGQVAASLGFRAVEMSDEHGTSYLVLPNTPIARA